MRLPEYVESSIKRHYNNISLNAKLKTITDYLLISFNQKARVKLA